jgi:hypothetical protein
MILFFLLQFSWSQGNWDLELNKLESTSSALKYSLKQLKENFSVSKHGNIPLLSIEDSIIHVELDIQSLENQIDRLKHP